MISVIQFKLLEMLKKRDLDQIPYRELAKRAGLDHVSLWKLANGKDYNPSLETLDKLCSLLKCQPGELLRHKK